LHCVGIKSFKWSRFKNIFLHLKKQQKICLSSDIPILTTALQNDAAMQMDSEPRRQSGKRWMGSQGAGPALVSIAALENIHTAAQEGYLQPTSASML